MIFKERVGVFIVRRVTIYGNAGSNLFAYAERLTESQLV